MVLNYIWVAFFVIAFIVALCKLIFMGDVEIFTELVNSTFSSSKTAFEISLGLTGILALWLGVMKIGENSGMINALSRWLSPVFCRLFPEIPKGHPAMGSIFMNLSANMLGLDNAATPMGLKAMKEHPGNTELYFKVTDDADVTHMSVDLISRPVRLSVGRDLITYLKERPELGFHIN